MRAKTVEKIGAKVLCETREGNQPFEYNTENMLMQCQGACSKIRRLSKEQPRDNSRGSRYLY